MKSILFLVPNATQPRFYKRINEYNNSWETHIFYYVRNNYNTLNSIPKAHYSSFIGELESASYLARIPKYLKLYIKLRRTNTDVLYPFGLDLLIVAYFSRRKRTKIFYEMGDIRQLRNKTLNQALSFILKNVFFKRVDRVFVTSYGFKSYVENLYDVHESKIEVIENKIDPKVTRRKLVLKKDSTIKDCLVLGIVGYFRYENVVHFLRECSCTEMSRFRILIYGHGEKLSKMLPYCDNKNIIYKGQFNAQEDLDKIYSQIHYSYVVYDNRDLNVRLALPNKLYESMYFQVPMIVASNTYLSQKVEELNIGISTEPNSCKELIDFLGSLASVEMYYMFTKNFSHLDPKMYLQ